MTRLKDLFKVTERKRETREKHGAIDKVKMLLQGLFNNLNMDYF